MLELLARNYYWFLIIAGILVFALIGYVLDKKKNAGKTEKVIDEEEKERENIASITSPMMTLGDALKKQEEVEEVPAEPIPIEVNKDSDIEAEEDPSRMIIDEPDS